jgi:outer membrane lipoprotein-sorting protein
MNRLHIPLLAVVLLAGSLMFACKNDKKDNGNNQTPTATTSSSGGQTPSEGNTPSGDAQAELDQLAGEFANKEAKVGYNYTTTAAGTSEQGSFTLYWKPPDAWRLDISSSSGDVIMVSSGGKTYFCSQDAGTGQCIESPTAGAIPLPFLNYFTDPSSLTSLIDSSIAGVSVDKSSETIGGQDAICYAFSGTASGEAGSGQYCFGSGGLLLRLKTSGGGSDFTLEATSVSGTVADADVQPPYDIIQIPGG